MLFEGKVGPQALSDGASNALRLARSGASIVRPDGLGSYAEAVDRGLVFFASTQAGVALTTTLSATATGFILTNPVGSGKNLILLDALFALTTAPAGIATLGWAAQFNEPVVTGVTHTTPLTVRSAKLQNGVRAGVGLADSSATLPNVPVAVRWVPGGPVATGTLNSAFIRDEINGLLVLAPGSSLNTFVLTTAISAGITVYWAEVDTV